MPDDTLHAAERADIAAIRALYAERVYDHLPFMRWGKFDRALVGELLAEVDRLEAEHAALRRLLGAAQRLAAENGLHGGSVWDEFREALKECAGEASQPL